MSHGFYICIHHFADINPTITCGAAAACTACNHVTINKSQTRFIKRFTDSTLECNLHRHYAAMTATNSTYEYNLRHELYI